MDQLIISGDPVRAGNPIAVRMTRQAGRDIGDVLAALVDVAEHTPDPAAVDRTAADSGGQEVTAP
ncbi:hypothetical protein [Streptomyces longwoodensis]|uniref:hypothetical protein n=1 Tax=Streptomyces longwoodensis TaxID=68231 RepID=UPI00341011E2